MAEHIGPILGAVATITTAIIGSAGAIVVALVNRARRAGDPRDDRIESLRHEVLRVRGQRNRAWRLLQEHGIPFDLDD